jgi:hypothetical protein
MHSLTFGALLLGAAAFAPSAHAQSCDSVPVVHSSYPADGAMRVPTNSPLYVYGPELEVDSTDVTLTDEAGAAVSVDVTAVPGGLLIDAFLGLDPNTTFELTVTPQGGGEEWSATFSTAAVPATPVQLEPPDVGVSVINQDLGTCGVVSAICVIGSVPARMTLEVVVSGEVLSLGGGEPAPAYTANPGEIANNACIEVRVREPGGNVSEPTRLCAAELGRFELAANAAAPRSCAAYSELPSDDGDDSESSDSGGCALGASGAATGAGGLLFGLAVLLAARWRRSPGCRR